MSDPLLTVTRDVEAPPGGWRYTVPETGVELRSNYAKTLRVRVRAHLEANGLPVPDDDTLNDAICRYNGFGAPFCGCSTPKPKAELRKHLTLATASRFVMTMMEVAKSRRFVSREEAERRMAVCMGCPLAVAIGGCEGCSAVFRTINRLLRRSPVAADKGREFCGACGCLLKLKTLIPNDVLDRAETERPPYAEGCWRLV